jgi:asparagine synthetase B (glutamine-hydrolysing)
MGSIVAMLSRAAPPTAEVAQRMLAAAPHRGSQSTVRVCGSCVLGVSNQKDFYDSSMSSEGPTAAVLRGSLDNAAELSAELEKNGYPATSSNPADVVVAAFACYGGEAPAHMRGDFTGVFTDGATLSCFRDPIGLRPMFYRDDPKLFIAGTEAKQVLAGAQLKSEPDLQIVEKIFYSRMSAGFPSALKGVSRLVQGHVLAASAANGTRVSRYWDPMAYLETARLSEDEIHDQFHALMDQAVRRVLGGKDVILLSGGIDSPTVAAFAAPRYRALTGRPLNALTAVYPDLPSVDESGYTKTVADYLGIELGTRVGESHPLKDLRDWCRLLDGPCPTVAFADMHNWFTYARDMGFNNVLTGEYAELLFTLDRHIIGHLMTRFRWTALARLLARERGMGRSWKGLGRMIAEPFVPGSIANRRASRHRATEFRYVPDWVDINKVNEVPARPDLLRPVRARWSELQVLPFEGCAVTTEADELCATISGVTVRRPFADIDLWKFFLSLRAESKFPDLRSKTLVRSLMRGKLPDVILDRRDKTVFNDYMLSHVPYATLRHFIDHGDYRMPGVDYRKLSERLDGKNFKLVDWIWANDLARVHAFLSLWE